MKPRFLEVLLLALLVAAGTGCSDSPVEPEEKNPEEKPSSLPAGPALGVNYNGQFDRIRYADLERTGTTWVAGVHGFFQLYEKPSSWRQDASSWRRTIGTACRSGLPIPSGRWTTTSSTRVFERAAGPSPVACRRR
jgi:hypothetical protein